MKRLASLFLLGTVYASVVPVPALVVYWAVADVSAVVVAGGIVLLPKLMSGEIDVSQVELPVVPNNQKEE